MSGVPNKFTDVKPKYPIPQKPHPTANVLMYYLDGEIKEKFFELYPTHTNSELMKIFDVCYGTITRFARTYCLQKDMDVIRRKQAKAAKKTNTESGYYASLRGRRPSEAAIEATKRIRAEGFSPLAVFKQKHPRKYKRMIKDRAEKRKDLIRRDRLRLEYGLPRLTKLRLTVNTLSHAARAQKSEMIRKKNYFSDPDHTEWVCYDSETDRSPQMEATAHRHGLYVVAGEEIENTEQQTNA